MVSIFIYYLCLVLVIFLEILCVSACLRAALGLILDLHTVTSKNNLCSVKCRISKTLICDDSYGFEARPGGEAAGALAHVRHLCSGSGLLPNSINCTNLI